MSDTSTLFIVAGLVLIVGGYLYYQYAAANTPGAQLTYSHGGLTVTGAL